MTDPQWFKTDEMTRIGDLPAAADIPAITAIYGHHVLHGLATFEVEPPDTAEMTRRFATIRELGLPYLAAVIGDSANLASIRLHEKFGFKRVGMLPAVGFKFGRWVDSVLMQRDLADGQRTAPV